MRLITFTDLSGNGNFPPVKTSDLLPDWYKKTKSYQNGKKEITDAGKTPATIKKCVPVFDAMALGYTLFTQTDIYVKQKADGPYFYWPSGEGIEFHGLDQAEKLPAANGNPYPKIINPYGIKTPKSYSTLFVAPLNNPNKFFTAIPGVVDTDKYSQAVNFPVTMNDPKWEGLIPAGTPIVQVIPIKRAKWYSRKGGILEKYENNKKSKKLNTRFFDKYKSFFWEKKEYN
jgi:hypothetical protein